MNENRLFRLTDLGTVDGGGARWLRDKRLCVCICIIKIENEYDS